MGRSRARGHPPLASSLTDPRSLSYRQVNTDPRRALAHHQDLHDGSEPLRAARSGFTSSRSPASRFRLYALLRPGAVGQRRRRRRFDRRHARWSHRDDQGGQRTRRRSPAFTEDAPNGYLGASDGWTRPARGLPRWTGTTPRRPTGNVVQTGRLELTGKAGSQDATLALGFGASAAAARRRRRRLARRRLRHRRRRRYQPRAGTTTSPAARGRAAPPATRSSTTSRLMVLAASEDKTYRGAGIASPTMAWVWGLIPRLQRALPPRCGRATSTRSPPPRSRPATARPQGGRSTTCGRASSSPTAACRRTRTSTALRTGAACSSTRSPTRSCSPGSSDAPTPATWSHVERAAECILANGTGHPGALGERDRLFAGEHRRRDRRAGVRRADRAGQRRERPPRPATARSPTTGSSRLERLDRDHQRTALALALLPATQRGRRRERGHHLHDRRRRSDRSTSDSSSTRASSSSCASASSAPTTPRAVNLPVVDRELGVDDAERPVLAPLQPRRLRRDPRRRPVRDQRRQRARLWPIFAGERGEYELAAGELAGRHRGRAAGGDDAARRDRQHRERGLDAPRAGLGRQAAGGAPTGFAPRAPARCSATPLGLDARPVHPPRLVDRRRPPGRAPQRRRAAATRSAAGA